MNYYNHHIGDYLTDTAHLSILEDGSYRRLMDRYYATEQPLPGDEQILFRLLRARSDDEKDAVRVVLAEFFVLTDAGWSHKRCDAEIAAYKGKSDKAKDAADKRWSKSSNASAMPTHSERIADALPTQCQPITNNQEPITNNQTPPASNTAIQPTPAEIDSVLGVTAVSLSIALRSAGVKSQPADPRLIELARKGVLPETLQAACAEAANSKPGEVLSVGYVLGIVERWSREATRISCSAPKLQSSAVVAHIRPEKFNPTAHVNRQRKAQ